MPRSTAVGSGDTVLRDLSSFLQVNLPRLVVASTQAGQVASVSHDISAGDRVVDTGKNWQAERLVDRGRSSAPSI